MNPVSLIVSFASVEVGEEVKHSDSRRMINGFKIDPQTQGSVYFSERGFEPGVANVCCEGFFACIPNHVSVGVTRSA
jgi:hypothetical protein